MRGTNTREDVLAQIAIQPGCGVRAIMGALDMTRSTAHTHICRLRQAGLIRVEHPAEGVATYWPAVSDSSGEVPIQRIVPASETTPPKAGPRSVFEVAR